MSTSIQELLVSKRLVSSFREREGTTVIVKESVAKELDLKYEYVAAWIELEIHSSLEAVGLTAAVSTALAKRTSISIK